MKIETIVAIISCTITCGSVLIYIGRSLGTLEAIKKGVEVALSKTDRHDKDIEELKVGLAEVKTRQDDCGNCP